VTTESCPTIPVGTLVRTTKPDVTLRLIWAENKGERRKWGFRGSVVSRCSFNGIMWYGVELPGGNVGFYQLSELEVIQ